MGKKNNAKLPHRTDAGNAELFAGIYKNTIRFDHHRKRWLLWKDHWWVEDEDGEVLRKAKNAARRRLLLASDIEDEEERLKEVQWAFQSESRYRLEATLALAKAERFLADPGRDWDSNPFLLGVANGVVDLRTGLLRKGDPSDRITLHTNVPYDPSAECPRWREFLVEVFNGDEELIAFIQKAIGYSLSGETSEQCLFLCHGEGSNGKTTFLEVLRFVAGDYAYNLPFSAFELKARRALPNDVAALVNRRFVTAIETNDSVRLNEARVKGLTGGDVSTARFLYHEFFQFRPTAKFWLAFNHKPVVADDSHGFWRRIRLIPFLQKFDGSTDDKHLKNTLLAEAQGVLAWTVEGCRMWQVEGLGLPPAVDVATKAYREESDPLQDFLSDCCVIHPDAEITKAVLWQEYLEWGKENGERWPLDRGAFTRRLEGRGLREVRLGHVRTRTWAGICRKIDAQAQDILVPADTRTDEDA